VTVEPLSGHGRVVDLADYERQLLAAR
jgi:hypothetical protein